MEEREEETAFSIWVNWERRVISFTQENGFEELSFPTHEEKFQFAIERGVINEIRIRYCSSGSDLDIEQKIAALEAQKREIKEATGDDHKGSYSLSW